MLATIIIVPHACSIITAIIIVVIIAMQAYDFVSYIQEQNINITGVNTVSDRESIPGYRDNYVKCCCSHGGLQKLQTELKILTGKEVNIRKII